MGCCAKSPAAQNAKPETERDQRGVSLTVHRLQYKKARGDKPLIYYMSSHTKFPSVACPIISCKTLLNWCNLLDAAGQEPKMAYERYISLVIPCIREHQICCYRKLTNAFELLWGMLKCIISGKDLMVIYGPTLNKSNGWVTFCLRLLQYWIQSR